MLSGLYDFLGAIPCSLGPVFCIPVSALLLLAHKRPADLAALLSSLAALALGLPPHLPALLYILDSLAAGVQVALGD